MTSFSCQLPWIWSQLREDKPVGTPRRGFLDRVSRNGKVHPKHGQHFWVVSQSKEVQGEKLLACLPSGLTGEFIYSVAAAMTSSTDIRIQSSAFYMDQWPAVLQEYSRCLVQTGTAKTSSSWLSSHGALSLPSVRQPLWPRPGCQSNSLLDTYSFSQPWSSGEPRLMQSYWPVWPLPFYATSFCF